MRELSKGKLRHNKGKEEEKGTKRGGEGSGRSIRKEEGIVWKFFFKVWGC